MGEAGIRRPSESGTRIGIESGHDCPARTSKSGELCPWVCADGVHVVYPRRRDADGIMQRVKALYGSLNSYADSGVVLFEYGPATSPSVWHHSFTTHFMRAPRHFLFDFHKDGGDRFVV